MSVHHDRLIEGLLRQLEPGCPILTSDGHQVGTLAEMRGEYLRISAPLRRDFWLKADFVVVCEPGRVELSFAKDDLNAYKQENIDREDPLKEQASADLLVSEEEQIEQRMRMERDLAEQRRRLVEEHGKPEAASPSEVLGTVGEPVERELEQLERRYGPVDDKPVDPLRAGAGANGPPAGPDSNGSTSGRTAEERTSGTTGGIARELGYREPVQPPEPFPSYVPPQRRGRVRPWMLGLAGVGVLLGAGFLFRRSRRRKRLIERITER